MKKDTSPRFYAESDGGPAPMYRTHYVVDRYADPMSEQRRTDVPSTGYLTNGERKRWASKKAREFNANPPWPAWDHKQAIFDEYEGEVRCWGCDGLDPIWCEVCKNTSVTTSPI